MNADTIIFLGCGFAAVGLLVVTAFYSTERKIMGVNESLLLIKSNLDEATAELVAKIAELKDQLATGDPVDQALLAEVEVLAQGLADIVPNPVEEPAEPVEEPAESVDEVAEPVIEEPTEQG